MELFDKFCCVEQDRYVWMSEIPVVNQTQVEVTETSNRVVSETVYQAERTVVDCKDLVILDTGATVSIFVNKNLLYHQK